MLVVSRSLSGGSPRRLWQERGQWMLEVVRHVNIGNDLVRPTTECLSGNRLISSYFKSNPDHEPLGRMALKLMQSQGGDGRSYSAVGSEWVSSSLPPGRLAAEAGGHDPAADAEAQLATLRQRVKVLVRVQETLLRRLARLELRALDLNVLDNPGLPAAPAAAGGNQVAEAGARLTGAEAAAAAVAAELAPSIAHVPAAMPAEPGSPPRRSQAPIALDARARPLAALELPAVAELCKCIALLVGSGLTVEEAEPLSASALESAFAAGIETDSGEQVGLIVMDLRATVFLGGSLMMQPPEQLEQQFASASPEPDSIAASAEICNALSAAVNAGQSRYHVRATALAQLEPARYDWLPEVSTRRDLEDSLGGRTTLLARPGA